MKLPFSEMGKRVRSRFDEWSRSGGKSRVRVEAGGIKSSVLDVLSLRCLVGIQGHMSSRQLDIKVKYGGSKLEIHVWESSAYRQYLKP